MKPIFKIETTTIEVAYCPNCKAKLEKVTDPDAATIMSYHCPKCHWSY